MKHATMSNRIGKVSRYALLAALVGLTPFTAYAQGTDSKEAVDAIVGSKVEEEQTNTALDARKLIAAIDQTADATQIVRKVSKLDKVEIVFLTDAATSEGGPPPEIAAKVKEKQADISELRKELEGNAMLFHAIDSRQILVDDVLAVSFDSAGAVTIYAAAKPAG